MSLDTFLYFCIEGSTNDLIKWRDQNIQRLQFGALQHPLYMGLIILESHSSLSKEKIHILDMAKLPFHPANLSLYDGLHS